MGAIWTGAASVLLLVLAVLCVLIARNRLVQLRIQVRRVAKTAPAAAVLMLAVSMSFALLIPQGSVASAAQVVATIPVGAGGYAPQGVAVNPTTNRIFSANFTTSNVSVIDGANNTVVNTVPLGSNPYGVAVNPTTNRIYTANSGNSVSVIDGATNTVVATVPVYSGPRGVAVNPATNRIYTGDGNSVSVIDGANNTVVATVPIAGNYSSQRGVAVNPTTNRIYTANNGSNDVSVIDGASNTVVATIPVGGSPQGVAVNPTTNRIYATNSQSNGSVIDVIDGATNTVVTAVSIGIDSRGLAVNPTTNRIYTTNQQSVLVIDGVTNTVLATLPGNGALAAAVNSTTNRIYTANYLGSNSVSVIDGATNTVMARVPVGSSPQRVAVNPTTNRIYTANRFTSDISVIDGATNTVVTTVRLDSGYYGPYGVAVNPTTNRIYTANADNGTVSVIDGASNTVVATIPVGGSPQGVAVNPTTNRIYATNSQSNGSVIDVIDGATNTVVATVPITGSPFAVAVNPATNRIYTTNSQSKDVWVIDGATNTVLATVPIGGGPSGLAGPLDVAVNPTTNRIYTANFGPSTVTVIDGATNTVVTTIPVGSFPQGVAVNPTTNRIYTTNRSSNDISVIDGATNTVVATIPVGTYPLGVAVSSTSSHIYVANFVSDAVSVIEDSVPTTPTPTPPATPVPQADLSITKTITSPASPLLPRAGQSLTYTIVVTNHGPATATNVTLTDPLPPNVFFDSVVRSQGTCSLTNDTLTCLLGSLAKDATATVELNLTPVTAATNLTNTASVKATEPDPEPKNDKATVVTRVTNEFPIFNRTSFEPYIAVDPKNAGHLVVSLIDVSDQPGASRCTWAESRDGGSSWATGVLTLPKAYAPKADPWVRYGPNGELLYSCLANKGDQSAVFVAISSTGLPKDFVVSPNPVDTADKGLELDRPSVGVLTVAGKPRYVACWSVLNLPTGPVVRVATKDDGKPWSKPRQLAGPGAAFCTVGEPTPGLGIGITWRLRSDAGKTDTLELAVSQDGINWPPRSRIGLGVLDDFISGNGNDLIPEGSAGSPSVGSTTGKVVSAPYAAVVANGSRMRAVYQSRVDNRSRVHIADVEDNGTGTGTLRFARPVVDLGSSTSEMFLPAVSSCGNSPTIVAAYESPDPADDASFVFTVWSVDSTAASQQKLFETGADLYGKFGYTKDTRFALPRIGDYNGAACYIPPATGTPTPTAGTPTAAWAAWADTRSGEPRVWGAYIPLP